MDSDRVTGDHATQTLDLSIIIVSWNVRELLCRCLQSLADSDISFFGLAPGHTPGTMQPNGTVEQGKEEANARRPESTNRSAWTGEVIVVDNASADGSVGMVWRRFPWVRVLANQENLGFTRANNQGLAISRGRYLLFLNPDTEVARDALSIILRYAEDHPSVGIIGPQLCYGDGSLQSSRRRFPTLATLFLESTLLQRWFPENRILHRYYMLDRPDDVESSVDWVVGACMLVRQAVLDQIGGFDPGFFMYCEELDLCRRAKHAGWQVVYLPSAVVVHHEGKSSEQVVAARHIRFFTSRVRYVGKYHGQWAAAMVRSFVLLTFVYQWAEEGLKWLLAAILPSQRSKRAMRRQRMAAYRQVLRSKLQTA